MKAWIGIICICLKFAISKGQPYFNVASIQRSSATHFLFNDHKKIPLAEQWFAVNVNYAVAFNKKNLFVANAGYEKFTFEIKDSSVTQNFTSIYLPLTVLHTWKDTSWTTSFTYIPRVNSYNPVTINENTLQHGGAIIFKRILNDHFKYSVGIYYNREFFGNYIMPLLGMEWRASQRLFVFGLLPNNFTVDYKVNNVFHTGFVFKGITTSFRYKPASTSDYFRMDEGQLKLFGELYLVKKLVLNLEGGFIVNRRYAVKPKDTGPPIEYHARKATIIKLGLYYRLWL